MILPGDVAAAVRTIAVSERLFRLSLVSDLLRQALLIFLPLILYQYLEPDNENRASLMGIGALVGVSISNLNEPNPFAVLLLSSGAGYLSAFKADQLNNLVIFFLELRTYGTFIPQLFSFWVLLFGYLVFKSGYLPRILGILLMLGGVMLYSLGCYLLSFPQLRRGDPWLVCVYCGIVVLGMAFDLGCKRQSVSSLGSRS